jgi:hypothetical protein
MNMSILKSLAIAAMSIAVFVSTANAQLPYIPGPISGPRVFPQVPYRVSKPSPPQPESPLVKAGEGCSNFGVKIIEAVENAAKENRGRAVKAGYYQASESGKLQEIVYEAEQVIRKEYWARMEQAGKTGGVKAYRQIDLDYFIPMFQGTQPRTDGALNAGAQGTMLIQAIQSMEATKFQGCFPETWKTIQQYSALLNQQAKEKAEAAREAARAANLPANRVITAYKLYTLVKYCNQIREGYLLKYVNDVEMERAETVIRAIVNKAKSEDPSIDTDKLWSAAQQAANGQTTSQSYCGMYYQQLLAMSPISPYNIQKPL